MEVYNTKGVIVMYPLAFLAIMLILLNGYCCGAAVLVKTNTTFRCDGRLDEYLIEDDLELEFLMNPYVSRVLAGTKKESVGNKAVNNENEPAMPCGDQPYGHCDPTAQGENKHKCEAYKRKCN